MTEEEWQSCTDFKAMADALQGWVSPRKDRLFNVACCRRVWHLYRKGAVRDAILVGERYADGMADRDELRAALRTIHAARSTTNTYSPDGMALHAAGFTAAELNQENPFQAAWEVIRAVSWEEAPGANRLTVQQRERAALCGLLREFFPPPYRRVILSASWLTPSVDSLARGIYDDQAFDAMPILADALEDAGCTDAALLDHCRTQRMHHRGCWALDLLLGRS
jgi:hypothetical protein